MSCGFETCNGRDDGFTLFETVVTIAILSTVIVAFALFAGPSRKGSSLESVTMTISTALRAARSQAVARNDQVSFVFDTQERRAFVEPGELQYSLPGSFEINITAARLPTVTPNQSRILFFGDGSSSGGTIEITSGTSTNRVEVVWLTGGVSVTELP